MKTKITTVLAALAVAGAAFAEGPVARLTTPVTNVAKAPVPAPTNVAGCRTMVVASAPMLKTDELHQVKDCASPVVNKTAECKRACERR